VIPPGVRIFVCTEAVDMRLGFDRLAYLARSRVGEDPEGGSLFVFGNRGANRVKCLWFDRNGYCLLYKRLHRAVFELPLAAAAGSTRSVRIDGSALVTLLAGAERARHSRRRDHTRGESVR
jgi:transposase